MPKIHQFYTLCYKPCHFTESDMKEEATGERFLLRSSLPSPIAAIGLLREEEWLLDTTIR
jgi:hypothetical protein